MEISITYSDVNLNWFFSYFSCTKIKKRHFTIFTRLLRFLKFTSMYDGVLCWINDLCPTVELYNVYPLNILMLIPSRLRTYSILRQYLIYIHWLKCSEWETSSSIVEKPVHLKWFTSQRRTTRKIRKRFLSLRNI